MKYNIYIITILAILFSISCEVNEDVNDTINNTLNDSIIDNEEKVKYKIFDIAVPPLDLGGWGIIESLIIDNENNLWMGCRPLLKLTEYSWETFGADVFGDRNCCGNEIDFDSKGNVWFGTYNGLFIYNGESWKSFFYIEEHPYHTSVSNVHCDKDDNVWFAKGWDLVCFDGIEWTTFEFNKTFFGEQIQKITSDISGNIFIGCYDALYKYDGNEFTKIYYSKKEGDDMNIQDLDFDEEGRLWISCRYDLLVLDGDEIIPIDASSIQNPNYDQYLWNVSSLAMNKENNKVAIGTWNTGLAFYNKQNFEFLRGSEFGIDTTQFQINELEYDNNNNLWIVTRFGKVIVYNEEGLIL